MNNFEANPVTSSGQFNVHERAKAAKKSTLVSVVVNIVLMIGQIIIGIFSHSQALIADGIHSLSDLLSDFVVLLANKFSHVDADDNHPYGHMRFETGASFVLGLLLLAVGIGMLISSGAKLNEPHLIPTVGPLALWVAVIALISKEILFRYMIKVAKRYNSSMLIANAWHARSDAASSFIVALGIFGNIMGYKLLDPIAAAVVGFVICRMGWKFAWSALHDLMDSSASEEEINAIRLTLLETDGVLGVHELRTRKMGDMLVVDVHLEVDATITVVKGHDIAVDARDHVMLRHNVLSFMAHLDPKNVFDADHYSLQERAEHLAKLGRVDH